MKGNWRLANDVINSGASYDSSTVKIIAQITWRNSAQERIFAEFWFMLLLVVKMKDFTRTYLAPTYSQSHSLHERYRKFKEVACHVPKKSDNLYNKLNITVFIRIKRCLSFSSLGLHSKWLCPPSFLLRHVLADTSFFILLGYLVLHGPIGIQT